MSNGRLPRLYELPSTAQGLAAPLFAKAGFDRALIEAVFEGRQIARLFVDDPGHPRAALMCRSYDWYLAGDSGAGTLRQFIADAPAEAAVFETLYGCVPIQETWLQGLMSDSPGRWEVIPRRGFRFAGSRDILVRQQRARDEGVVRRLDRRLAEQADTVLGEHIGLLWTGYDRFVQGGFGFCAFVDGRPVSTAYTVSVSERYANLAVSTAEPFRRRGLAALVCSACITHGLDRGLITEWDSDASNTASIALASSLGFEEGPGFTEMSPPGRAKLRLSRGLWAPVALTVGTTGTVAWRRCENGGSEVVE